MKYGTNVQHMLIAVILAWTFGGCMSKPQDPMAPRWDVGLSMPVANKSYTMAEIVEKDSSILSVQPGGTLLMYKTSLRTDRSYVGDLLSLDPLHVSAQATLGSFALGGATVAIPVVIPGATSGFPIPPAPSITLDSASGTIPGIQQALLKSGTATLTVRNTYPAPLTFLDPVNIKNTFGTIVGSFVFSPSTVPAGGQISASVNLTEKLVTSSMELTNMRVSTTGSGGQNVQPGNALNATIVVGNLVAHNAVFTQIPPQILVNNDTTALALQDSTLFKEVRIHSGSLAIHFASHVDVNMFFRYRLIEVLRQGGQTYVDSVLLGPGSTQDKNINLAGFTMRSTDGDYLHDIHVVSTVNMYQGSNGVPVQITEADSVGVSVQSSTLVADSVVAAIKPTSIQVYKSVALNLGDLTGRFKGQLNIPAANLRFTPETDIQTPMQLNLMFEAVNKQGQRIATLPVPSKSGGTGREIIDFSPQDVGAFLSQISGALPDSIRVVGSVILNQNYDLSQPIGLGRNSSFGGSLDFGIPMNLAIQNGSLVDTTTVADTTGDGQSDSRIDSKTLDNARTGRLHVEFENGLPLEARLKVRFLNRQRQQLLMIPQAAGDSITVLGGVVAGGDVQLPTLSQLMIELSGAEMKTFNDIDLAIIGLSFSTPAGIVNFRSTDKVHLRMWVEVIEQVQP
jgi:hypothetical protein